MERYAEAGFITVCSYVKTLTSLELASVYKYETAYSSAISHPAFKYFSTSLFGTSIFSIRYSETRCLR